MGSVSGRPTLILGIEVLIFCGFEVLGFVLAWYLSFLVRGVL